MKNKNWLRIASVFVFIWLAVSIAGQINASEKNPANTNVTFNNWSVVGPSGGDVRAMAVDPKNKNRFYFGTIDGQIYTSSDAGKTWQLLVNFNRPQLIIDDMIVDPRDSKTIYASGHRHRQPGGFFKTSDSGQTWREIKDLKNEAIHALVQSSRNPDIILAGADAKIFISKDSGNSFEQIKPETWPNEAIVDSLAIDPRDDNVIYAGTTYRAFKTTDGGKNWRVINDGMIDDSDVFAINIDPRNPDHIIASACSGIYDSVNKGEKWRKIQGIPSQSRRTRAILQHPSDKNYVYAGTTEGFWMSADGGATWTLTTSRQLETNSITVHPDEPNKVYIGTNNYGVMVSTDYGKTFSMTNGGFSTRFTYLITADIDQPNRFYAVTHNTATGGGFFFVSDDGGENWSPSMKNYPSRVLAYSVLQDKMNPDTIYLGTNMGLYRSLDRGKSWAAVTAPKPKVTPRKKTVRKTTAKTTKTTTAIVKKVPALTESINVISYTNDGKNGILAATNKGLYRSYDISQGWEIVALPKDVSPEIWAIKTSIQQPETIWVGTAKSGLIVSKDKGLTWQKVGSIPTQSPISAIEVDLQDPTRVYVGTKQTFYLSRNGGQTFERRGGGLPVGEYVAIAISPKNNDEIYVSSSLETRSGVYYSADAGMTWRQIDQRETRLPSHRFWTMAFDPSNPDRLLLGTHSSGIYVVEKAVTTAQK